MNQKKIKNLIRGIVAGSLILGASPSMVSAGSASTSLSVSATVANNCTISTSSLAFGAYDPIVANATTALNGTGTVTITCTKGAATTVGLDAGSNAPGTATTRAMLSGSTKLSYEIYQDSSRATLWGNSGTDLFTPAVAPSKSPRSFTVYGQVPAGQDIPAGSYSDTVLATVNF